MVDYEPQHVPLLEGAWFEAVGEAYEKHYPLEAGADDTWYRDLAYVEQVGRNFAELGPEMFERRFDWEASMLELARRLDTAGIEWAILGSVSEAVQGALVSPHDLDIVVDTEDFGRTKQLLADVTVEPFVDNKGNWLVRYFGRLCVLGAMVDLVADEKMNPSTAVERYVAVSWRGLELRVEPLAVRLAVEQQRGRSDRIRAIEDVLECSQS